MQDLLYKWETNGTLLKRTNERDTDADIIESFAYDDLNRLENSDTNSSGRTLTQTFDDHGNILTKLSDISGDLDVTSYSYPTPTKPHRLASVTVAGISNSLSYDSVGNITKYDASTGDDTYIGYDDASRVKKITVGSSSTDSTPTARDEFWYGPDGQRFLRKASWMDGSLKTSWTLYLLGGTFEEVHPAHDSAVDYRQRVLVTANVQHQYVKPSVGSATTSIDYIHRDHLGNVVVRSNSSGTVLSEVGFDPFGLQRGVDWGRDQSSGEKEDREDEEDTFTARGFTDHEMLNRTGFVHMNGRVFDSRIGRFIQPDPIVGSPTLSQNYNKYAYVVNSPLSLTDPSGFDFCPRLGGCTNGTSPGPFVTQYGGNQDYMWTRYNDYGEVADTGYEIGYNSSPDVGFQVTDFSRFDNDLSEQLAEPGRATDPFNDKAFAELVLNHPGPINSDLGTLGFDTGSGLDFNDSNVIVPGHVNQMMNSLNIVKDPIADGANNIVVGSVTLLTVGPSTISASLTGLKAAKNAAIEANKFVRSTARRRAVTALVVRLFNSQANFVDDLYYYNQFIPPSIAAPAVQILTRRPTVILILPPPP